MNTDRANINAQNFDTDLREAVEVMRRGGVVLYPTDTVWGLGCDARCQDAVERIFVIKRRADSKALISLVADEAMLERWVDPVPDAALQLIEACADDTPMTIVYDHPHGLAPALLAQDGSAAIRVTRERFSAALCRRMRGPVVSTSANISGEPAPSFFTEISPEILSAVDYVCLTRRNDMMLRKPSSVVKISDSGVIKILRP